MQPAGLRSIRWQLPLTYAGIALVAAVALSTLLIGLLRQYYEQQEFTLLENSTEAAARMLGFRLNEPLSEDALPALLGGVNFVPDFRVELLDPQGQMVFDSGIVDTFRIDFSQSTGGQPVAIQLDDAPAMPIGPAEPGEFVAAEAGGQMFSVQAPSPDEAIRDVPYTIRLDPTAAAAGAVIWRAVSEPFAMFGTSGVRAMAFESPFFLTRSRSSASVTSRIRSMNGDVIGFVRLSQPPAIGGALIESVTNGAIVAGSGAVLIAGILGWWVSLRLTRPLLALTDATGRMARGDLSVRVDVPRRDELGALAESFNAMAGKVEHTVAALRRFAADAAHELHTPLTAIKTNLELTQERPDEARLAEAVAQLERLEALADDLLDLSRLEVAEAPRTGSVDVGALVREVSEVYASRAEQAGVEFALEMAGPLPSVRANATLLRRALSNLLDNAVKFTPSGGDVLLATSAGDGALEFVVEDSGIGIPTDDLPALFSRFHRGSNTSGYPGSGLGLAIVKAIADVHHGTVTAERTARGARFVLRMPVASVQ